MSNLCSDTRKDHYTVYFSARVSGKLKVHAASKKEAIKFAKNIDNWQCEVEWDDDSWNSFKLEEVSHYSPEDPVHLWMPN